MKAIEQQISSALTNKNTYDALSASNTLLSSHGKLSLVRTLFVISLERLYNYKLESLLIVGKYFSGETTLDKCIADLTSLHDISSAVYFSVFYAFIRMDTCEYMQTSRWSSLELLEKELGSNPDGQCVPDIIAAICFRSIYRVDNILSLADIFDKCKGVAQVCNPILQQDRATPKKRFRLMCMYLTAVVSSSTLGSPEHTMLVCLHGKRGMGYYVNKTLSTVTKKRVCLVQRLRFISLHQLHDDTKRVRFDIKNDDGKMLLQQYCALLSIPFPSDYCLHVASSCNSIRLSKFEDLSTDDAKVQGLFVMALYYVTNVFPDHRTRTYFLVADGHVMPRFDAVSTGKNPSWFTIRTGHTAALISRAEQCIVGAFRTWKPSSEETCQRLSTFKMNDIVCTNKILPCKRDAPQAPLTSSLCNSYPSMLSKDRLFQNACD